MLDPTRPPVVERDEGLAMRWLERAASAGHAAAMVALGNVLVRQKDAARAEAWYRRAGEAGAADGWYNAGSLLLADGDPHRRREAPACFERAAAMGDVSAQFWLGAALHGGMEEAGLSADGPRAAELLRAAADGGHPEAALYLSRAVRAGDGDLGLAADPAAADEMLAAAAERGSGEAAYEMAQAALSEGRPAEAMHGFVRAGELGFAEGFNAAGVLAYRGGPWGGPDFPRALTLYQRAAELGSEAAWRSIAAMHAAGEGVPASPERARSILASLDEQRA